MIQISIVVPVFNEETLIKEFYDRLCKVLIELQVSHEVIFVDDGSTDDSLSILAGLQPLPNGRISIHSLSRNFGHQSAIWCGMEKSRGEAIVTIDCDLQDPPEVIPKMYSKYVNGSDIVFAKRITRGKESFFKRYTAKTFYFLMHKFSDKRIQRNVADFRLISKRANEAMLQFGDQEPFIRGIASWIGFNTSHVDYDRDIRISGESKYTIKKMFKLAFQGFLNFSGTPLKIPFFLSIITGLIALVLILSTIYTRIRYPNQIAEGYTSLFIVMLFSLSIQMFMFGILGSYIRRILLQANSRPRYLIRESKET